MNTKHLAYLVEVAKCKSISKAARNLYISQPSLSASIATLEDEIGVALFHRSQSGVTLTEQGEQILEVAVEMLRGVNKIEQIAKQDHTLTGQIRLSAVPAACGSFLVDLIALTQQRYPHLSIEVREERPHYIIQQVLKGEINLGLTSFLHKREADYAQLFQEKRLQFEPLYEDKLRLFVAPDHPLANRQMITRQEIKQYPMTSFQDDVYLHQLSAHAVVLQEKDDLLAHSTYRFNNLDSIKKIACNSPAMAILPGNLGWQDDFIRNNLVAIDIADKEMDFSVGIIYRSGGLLTNAEQCIVEMLREISGREMM